MSLRPLCAFNQPLVFQVVAPGSTALGSTHQSHDAGDRCREEYDSALSTAAKLASADLP